MGKITFRFEDESLETKILPSEKGASILDLAEDNDIHLNPVSYTHLTLPTKA